MTNAGMQCPQLRVYPYNQISFLCFGERTQDPTLSYLGEPQTLDNFCLIFGVTQDYPLTYNHKILILQKLLPGTYTVPF